MPPQPGVIVQDGRNPSPSRASWKTEPGKKPGRPRGLTNSKKRERDKQIVRDRLVNDLSWGALALKYDLDERSCRRIVAAFRTKNAESLGEIDPAGEVWDHLQAYEAQIERMRDLREHARGQSNFNALLGAERLIVTLRQAKLNLMQEAGMLPRNLGSLRHIHETRVFVETVMSVLTGSDAVTWMPKTRSKSYWFCWSRPRPPNRPSTRTFFLLTTSVSRCGRARPGFRVEPRGGDPAG